MPLYVTENITPTIHSQKIYTNNLMYIIDISVVADINFKSLPFKVYKSNE